MTTAIHHTKHAQSVTAVNAVLVLTSCCVWILHSVSTNNVLLAVVSSKLILVLHELILIRTRAWTHTSVRTGSIDLHNRGASSSLAALPAGFTVAALVLLGSRSSFVLLMQRPTEGVLVI